MKQFLKNLVATEMKLTKLNLLGLCVIIGSVTDLYGNDPLLLPVDAVQTGWNFNPDLGWSFVDSISVEGVWLWIPGQNPASGKWIYSSTTVYPLFWDLQSKNWLNINRTIAASNGVYMVTFGDDYLSGNSFMAIEAYVPAEGIGETFMKPYVTFFENHRISYFYSDFGGSGLWTYVEGRVLTNDPIIGDNLLYNPFSKILFLDGHKYQLLPTR